MGNFITAATTVQADRVHNDCARLATTVFRGMYQANADGTCPSITLKWCGSDFSDQPRYQDPADVGHVELYDKDGVLVHDFGFTTTAQGADFTIPGSWFQDGAGKARLGAWYVRCRQPTSGELAAHAGANVTATPDPLYGPEQGGAQFVIVPYNTVMPQPPVNTPVAADIDAVLYAVLGMPQRVGVSLHHPSRTPDSYHAGNAVAIGQMVTWFKGYDTARTRPDGKPGKLICLTFDDYLTTDASAVQTIAARSEYDNVDLFIATNEIKADGTSHGGVLSSANVAQQRSFYNAIKAARPTKLVGSATSVVSGPSATGTINGYFTAAGSSSPGATAGFDVLVLHDYPGGEGSAGYQDDYYGAHADLTWTGPIFVDEATGESAAQEGGGYPARQARRALWNLRARAKHNLPPEWTAYFQGFQGFPWWFESGTSSLGVGDTEGRAGVYQAGGRWYVHRLALWGTSQFPETVLELADPDDNHLISACVYRKTTGGAQPAPVSNAGVLDVQTLGDPDMALTFQLGGTVPATVTVWNGDGQASTATVGAGNRVLLDRTLLGGDGLMDGAYVFLPGGCTVTAVTDATTTAPRIPGVDLNISTDAGTAGVTTITNVLRPEGQLKNALVYDVANADNEVSPWRAGTLLHDGGTQRITITPAAGARRLWQVRLIFLPPWQLQSTATKFNLVGIRNGVETVLAVVDTNPAAKVLDWRTDNAGFSSWHLTFANDQHVFTVNTNAVVDAFRIDIKDATYGGSPTMNAATGFGRTTVEGESGAVSPENWTGGNLLGAGFAGPRRPALQRVTVHATAPGGGTVPGGQRRYLVRAGGGGSTPAPFSSATWLNTPIPSSPVLDADSAAIATTLGA